MRITPSVKATFFQFAADEVERLLAKGKISRASLAEYLQPSDFHYLNKRLALSSWVPIATHARVIEVLIAFEGGGEPQEYLRCIGAYAAPLVRKMGVYQQLEASSAKWGPGGVGRIFATVGAVAYNFSRWSYEEGPDSQPGRIVVDEARDFPECFRFTSEGFLGVMWKSALDRHDIAVRSERVTRDRITFQVVGLKPEED